MLVISAATLCHAENKQVPALPLVVNGREMAALPVRDIPNGHIVATQDVLALLEGILLPKAFKEISTLSTQPEWTLGKTYGSVTLTFDEVQVAIIANIPASALRPARLDLQDDSEVPNGRLVKPNTHSAYLNMYASESYLDGFGAAWQGRQAMNMDFDGAVNLNGWVLEGQPNYIEGDARPWMIQNVRVVHDDTEHMLRYQAGELSYPTSTFQYYRPLAGVGFARNFSLQPYFQTQPAGQSGFVVGSASTVDIYVNGVRRKSLQVQPGVYELSDFPVVNGANDVKLVITDASGRVEEKTFPIVSDGTLLGRGIAEFSANVGVPVQTINRVRTFDEAHPVVSGLVRYGLRDNWTSGLNFQGGETQQNGGMEQAFGTRLGVIRTEYSLSNNTQNGRNESLGNAARIEYRNISSNVEERNHQDMWQLAWNYQSAFFNSISSTSPANAYDWEVQTSYGHTFTPDFSMTLGNDYRSGRANHLDDYRTSLDFYYRILPQWTLNLNTSHSQQEQYGVFVNLSWSGLRGTQMVNSSYDSSNQVSRVDWDYRPERTSSQAFSSDVQMERSPDADTLGGTLNYEGERGTLRLEHSQRYALDATESTGRLGTSTQLSAAAALVYSDGDLAVSRPVAGSFAIVKPASKVSNTLVTLNPVEEGSSTSYEAQSSWFGPAVMTELTPYMYHSVNADITQRQDVMRDSFVLQPTYKSGTSVAVGKKSYVTVSGYLKDADQKPLGFIGGRLATNSDLAHLEPSAGPGDARKQVLVFTNREGRFQLDDLEPGRYTLVMNGNQQTTLDFDVPDNVDNVDLGSKQLDMRPGRSVATSSVSASLAMEPAAGPPTSQP